jgi:hypothetical protein
VPLLREAIASLILRPFLADVPAAVFPGAAPGMSFDVLEKWHPDLLRAVVPIPQIGPGDSVWWHPDLIHEVESAHRGVEDSAVLYMPAFPATPRNAVYLARQRVRRHPPPMRHVAPGYRPQPAGARRRRPVQEHFEAGRTPPDFPANDSEARSTPPACRPMLHRESIPLKHNIRRAWTCVRQAGDRVGLGDGRWVLPGAGSPRC